MAHDDLNNIPDYKNNLKESEVASFKDVADRIGQCIDRYRKTSFATINSMNDAGEYLKDNMPFIGPIVGGLIKYNADFTKAIVALGNGYDVESGNRIQTFEERASTFAHYSTAAVLGGFETIIRITDINGAETLSVDELANIFQKPLTPENITDAIPDILKTASTNFNIGSEELKSIFGILATMFELINSNDTARAQIVKWVEGSKVFQEIKSAQTKDPVVI